MMNPSSLYDCWPNIRILPDFGCIPLSTDVVPVKMFMFSACINSVTVANCNLFVQLWRQSLFLFHSRAICLLHANIMIALHKRGYP